MRRHVTTGALYEEGSSSGTSGYEGDRGQPDGCDSPEGISGTHMVERMKSRSSRRAVVEPWRQTRRGIRDEGRQTFVALYIHGRCTTVENSRSEA